MFIDLVKKTDLHPKMKVEKKMLKLPGNLKHGIQILIAKIQMLHMML